MYNCLGQNEIAPILPVVKRNCDCHQVLPSWHIYSPDQLLIFQPPKPPCRYSLLDRGMFKLDNDKYPLYYVHFNYTPPKVKQRRLFLFFHGNSCDLYDMTGFVWLLIQVHAKQFPDIEVHSVAMEYGGYGLAASQSCDVSRIKQDASRLLEHLQDKLNLQQSQIWIMGQSIGTGVCSYLAAHTEEETRERFAAVYLFSPFTNLRDLGSHLFPSIKWLRMLCIERFDNVAHIKRIKLSPVLMVHGAEDTVIPIQHAEQLYSVCRTTLKVLIKVPNVGHVLDASRMLELIMKYCDSHDK